jgi:hypothetical protein
VTLGTDYLLEGERSLKSKLANAIIRRSDYNLDPLVAGKAGKGVDALLGMVGLAGTEAIGGRLHVTNYRVVFKSHVANRVTGVFSVFFPTIRSIENTSKAMTRRISVTTQFQTFEFVAWGVPSLIQTISAAKGALTPELEEAMKRQIQAQPEKVGDGLERDVLLGDLNEEMMGKIAQVITAPFDAANLLNVLELLS